MEEVGDYGTTIHRETGGAEYGHVNFFNTSTSHPKKRKAKTQGIRVWPWCLLPVDPPPLPKEL